ncbi:MAG: hypothetical protein UT63_C0023G0004 [Candidatus Gottesmanbacteria bacterium GW2011_GWC2_39_8]|uniref:D-isomer specific 2-hydroxyacid dehydrogenase NAD-binding protein n=1 Tax=Candidatus Gottesmanbacteria bacterium GW2011_GWC2_39_8 TaxID=1618450 RepID=A0A0G0Q751_9BACT|nr:MAG: hypothetical protein UT63_C0023G0004 [Candidatus Gottesmanbacteria bacterium GW2011_GWC2_39_8]
MKILIIQSNVHDTRIMMEYKPEYISKIREIVPSAEIVVVEEILEEVNKNFPDTDILICGYFDRPDLVDFSIAKKLKWVHVESAGAQDISAALRHTDIIVTNSSGVHPIPIAEHVFGLLLMFTRKLNNAYKRQLEKQKWEKSYTLFPVEELSGKTMGIVGYGRIGKRIAEVAKSFGMKVIAIKHETQKEDIHADQFYKSEDLDILLAESDVLVNALPLTPETKGLFNLDKFKLMKRSAYFVNIGRGKTVIEKDLIQALKEEIIRGAGLDVFEEEPLLPSSPLWNLENVIITPHFAGWTPRYAERVIDIFCQNLEAYMKNEKMPNFVDKQRGY